MLLPDSSFVLNKDEIAMRLLVLSNDALRDSWSVSAGSAQRSPLVT